MFKPKINITIFISLLLFSIDLFSQKNKVDNGILFFDYIGYSINCGIGYTTHSIFDLDNLNSDLKIQATYGGAVIPLLNLRRATLSLNYNYKIPKSKFNISTNIGILFQAFKLDSIGDSAKLKEGNNFYPLLNLNISYESKDYIYRIYYPILNKSESLAFPGFNFGLKL